MKIKTLFIIFVLLAVALAACGTESINQGANNSNQNNPIPANVEKGNENQAEDQPAATPTEAPAAEEAEVSFANDVLPIFESRCLTCHGGERIEGGFVISSYASLMAGGEDGLVITAGDAAGSLLYELVSTGKMPKRGANLTPVQLEVIEQWINAGALDN